MELHNYIRAEISAGAIRHNVATLRGLIPAATKLCAVVKANAYGHGQHLLLETMSELADFLAVATPAEALELRNLGYGGELLVLFTACTDNREPHLAITLDALVRAGVTVSVASQRGMDLLTKSARRVGERVKMHLVVDTGMTRSGLPSADVPAVVRNAQMDPSLELAGIYSHFATADEADKSSAKNQLQVFMETLSAAGIDKHSGVIRHMANSAATIDLPEAHLDMVRPGIALFGYQPSTEMHNRPGLQPALQLSAHIMQTKQVPAGTRVGYGLTYEFDRDSRVGLVPLGYADGYDRRLGNVAAVRVGERVCPVRGRVSMDQISIDLTDCPEAEAGDLVEVISTDPAAPNSLEALAIAADTIPYELMCRLGARVRRTLVE
ncbi:MAG: alanine racemase [Phycisphaerales bacterium]|nr:alanine racemase [Phycisphaerales bacterium]MBT7171223.1 alanine racemase [Phycisphaerales bacterium]